MPPLFLSHSRRKSVFYRRPVRLNTQINGSYALLDLADSIYTMQDGEMEHTEDRLN